MTVEEIAKLLVAMGCPEEKSQILSSQLEKRARQLASEKNKSVEEAQVHLLNLMRQGWAAKERGI